MHHFSITIPAHAKPIVVCMDNIVRAGSWFMENRQPTRRAVVDKEHLFPLPEKLPYPVLLLILFLHVFSSFSFISRNARNNVLSIIAEQFGVCSK